MNDEYRLGYCKVCDNKKFDPERGLVCGLTDAKPTFAESCESYISSSSTGQLYTENTVSRLVIPVSGGKRFLHYIIDSIIFYIGVTLLLIPLITVSKMVESNFYNDLLEVLDSPLGYLFNYGIFISFYVMFEYLFMQTPGKMITKTVVVDEKGDKLSFGKLLGRSFMRLVPFDALSFLSSSNRGWHDKVAGSYVITKESYEQIQELKKEKENNRLVSA
jgi:uncharacterized RDD family membrane protein YckC